MFLWELGLCERGLKRPQGRVYDFWGQRLKQNFSPLIWKNESWWENQWHGMCIQTGKSEERAVIMGLLWQGLQNPSRGWLSAKSRQACGVAVSVLCKGHNRNWCREANYLIFTCFPRRWRKNGRGISSCCPYPPLPTSVSHLFIWQNREQGSWSSFRDSHFITTFPTFPYSKLHVCWMERVIRSANYKSRSCSIPSLFSIYVIV